ncbi:PPP4R2-domain-containing protein [Neocallimastix lanati (nom. inval.)]|jgi:hypothetical protein|uniref:PPP4R2-domain-containing protein n=1 Tax=Neocallimastix californiae TaxID=1754190 RepID=A0A1Y2EY47_9FUNG|nr:PPP4R2-domain-containing protein [Neocallimastix sp. JGI-2020a]ORY76164.1 PPP4R2-domain-containing protein [Neocallimastix californiae]|eukprot:ORY76164.1 PPP4R2-domain-containing protein [Neocallimastix californiae]
MTEENVQEIDIKQWNPTYDDYLLKTANTAEVVCNWNLLRKILRIKIKELCEQKMADSPGNQIINGESVEDFQMRIWSILDSFDEPPFTIQRLCELTTISHEQHKTVWKYLRAIEKVLLVTSCISSDNDLSMDMMTHFESNIKSKNLIDPLKVKIENPDLDTIFADSKTQNSISNNNSEEGNDIKMTPDNSDNINNKKDTKMEINEYENINKNELNNDKSNNDENNNSNNSNDMDISQ